LADLALIRQKPEGTRSCPFTVARILVVDEFRTTRHEAHHRDDARHLGRARVNALF
jgi:hypothetical protein